MVNIVFCARRAHFLFGMSKALLKRMLQLRSLLHLSKAALQRVRIIRNFQDQSTRLLYLDYSLEEKGDSLLGPICSLRLTPELKQVHIFFSYLIASIYTKGFFTLIIFLNFSFIYCIFLARTSPFCQFSGKSSNGVLSIIER